MVNVEKYIRKLLFEYNCVIIPEFGGLLTHHVGAHYDTTRGLFLPSTKRIAFNEVLRLDDGLLTYFISVNEHISRDEAVYLVKNYVETLRSELREGTPFVMSEIGSFTFNSEGKPVFEPDYTQNFTSEWFGLDSVKAQYCTSIQEKESVYSQEVTEVLVEETGVVLHRPIKWGKKWLSWAAAALVTGAIFTISLLYRPVDGALLSSLNPLEGINEFYTAVVSKLQKENEDVPVPTPVTEFETVQNQPVENSSVIEPVKTEALTTEVLVVKVPVEEVEPVKTEIAAPKKMPKGAYLLIAGSFEKVNNAQVLKKRLVRQGFKNAEVLEGPDGKLIKVSAGGYASQSQALQYKEEVDEISKADSWVLPRK